MADARVAHTAFSESTNCGIRASSSCVRMNMNLVIMVKRDISLRPGTTYPNAIRVVVADDHEMMRLGLNVFFQAFDDLELVGEAANGDEAIQLCSIKKPNVLLIELGLRRVNAIEVIRRVHQTYPDIYVIALVNLGEEPLIGVAMEAGAYCCLLKGTPIDAFAQAIREAYACSLPSSGRVLND